MGKDELIVSCDRVDGLVPITFAITRDTLNIIRNISVSEKASPAEILRTSCDNFASFYKEDKRHTIRWFPELGENFYYARFDSYLGEFRVAESSSLGEFEKYIDDPNMFRTPEEAMAVTEGLNKYTKRKI